MYRTKPPRRELLIRAITYTIMVTAVLAIVTSAILYMLGFRFNRQDNQVEQGGLVQFISQPQDARVTIDGTQTDTSTNGKLTLLPGNHAITFTKEGYHDWNATIGVAAGKITWLNYARMIPLALETEDVLAIPGTTTGMLASPDRKKIVFITKEGALSILNADDEQPVSRGLNLPGGLLLTSTKESPVSYSLQSWGGNRYVLVKAATAKSAQWILVDTSQPGNSVALKAPAPTDASISSVQLLRGGRAWYMLAANQLYYGELSKNTRLLAADVARFFAYDDDTVLYVTKPNTATQLQQVSVVHGDETPVTLFSKKEAVPLQVAGGWYFHKDYVAIVTKDDVRIFRGSLPKKQAHMEDWGELTRLDRPAELQAISFGPERRMVIMQGKHQVTVYDIEWARTTTVFSEVAPPVDTRTSGWIDSYTIWNTTAGTLTLRDFTGNNMHAIVVADARFGATLKSDSTALYSVRLDQETKQLYLQRTLLVIE